jgi:hypothetical protein
MLIPTVVICLTAHTEIPPEVPARPPEHPKAKAFVWVGSVLLRNGRVPTQRLHLFLDRKELRKALLDPRFKGMDRGEAALQACAKGIVSHGWRGEYLADMSGAFRSTILRSLLEKHWPNADFDPERPALKAFLGRCVTPRNQGDWVEEVLSSGAIYSRFRTDPWVVFEDADLYQARCSTGFAFEAEGRAEWIKLLRAAAAP